MTEQTTANAKTGANTNGKAPGFDKYPGYTISREAILDEVRVMMGDTEVCRTRDAIWLQESKHRPALYLPRKDVPVALLEASATQTYCPFKGTASYHSVVGVEDVLWYYPEPYVEVDYLVDYVGLYQDRVSAITVDGALVSA